MDFKLSPFAEELLGKLHELMDDHVYPAEDVARDEILASGDPHHYPTVLEDLKREARQRGLWNLFMPHRTPWTEPVRNIDYAPLAEIAGRSSLAPEAMNCSAPDTNNMDVLTVFGTPEQQEEWLVPLLEGEIRSCFAMTEPDVASSDATNISTRIERDGDSYVINGRKWWITGAASTRCKIVFVMGKTDPDAPPYRQQSMILVPLETPGVDVVRNLSVFGYAGDSGHCDVIFRDVRVPASNLIGGEGDGFAIAQSRLGPGRIHHCMGSIGAAERALELMCKRAHARMAFGRPLADQGVVQEAIANSRIELEQARLLVLKTAWLIDEMGTKAAKTEIAAIKVAVPDVALRVIDRAIQVHGGAGVSNDFPLARLYAFIRTLRIADGPDEVHRMTVARRELRKWAPEEQPATV